MHASGIRDNHSRGKAGEYVADLLTAKTDLSIVSAYFTIQAYGALKNKLNQIQRLRFLFGEPRFLSGLDRDRKASKAFRLTEEGLELVNQLSQRKLAKDCADWIKRKVEIRSVKRTGFLHGKMYHVRNGEAAHALIGSSNFTVPGLGLRENGNNVELNLVVDGNRDREDLLAWFNEWWSKHDLTEDVTEVVLSELERLYANQAPEFIYYLTLFHVFRDFVDGDGTAEVDLHGIALPDTGIWRTLYAFQKDGAKAVINKIQSLNGCILADSVGLGKTFTALAVIKYFELKNERALVLCPKKLRRNWTVYRTNSALNPFNDDRFRYDVLSHTDLSRERGDVDGIDLETLNWGNYDLLVIDESHNFRNNARARHTPGRGEEPRQTRYEKLINDMIAKGIRTKVLLLSATPVNNELSDLRNQISFIAGGDVARDSSADAAFHESLDVRSVKETTRKAQKQFTDWSKQPPAQRNNRDLLQTIGGDFFKLLDGLSIARSRKQIQRYYKDEMARIGEFPRRPAPRSIHPAIDLNDRYLSFEELDKEIGKLTLALYNPTRHLRADLPEPIRNTYQNEIFSGFTQEGREKILISMMKVNLLKRLESSVDSFRLTLSRTIDKIDALENKFSAFEVHAEASPDVDYDAMMPEDLDDPELEDNDFVVGGKRKFHLGHVDIPKWRQAVGHDRTQLQYLLDKTKVITSARDAKLAELKQEIAKKMANPTTTKDGRKNRKVLIFTAFADTARYLYTHLLESIRGQGAHAALICGDGGNKTTLGGSDYDDVLTNFSPISKNRAVQSRFPQADEIDVLIATDCISEGQNLQDCDLLINYDVHWNPVRIIQRFGRIDRIGSRNEAVHLINFWPVADLDRYLNVKHRVEARMALVDLSATQTDNLLEDGQLEELISKDLLFRNRQLERLKNEILDLEDFDDGVTLSDFSLDEFRLDLLQFLESRRAELEQANPGLYAVVPPKADNPIAQPGVIFCLRHRDQGERREPGRSVPAGVSQPARRAASHAAASPLPPSASQPDRRAASHAATLPLPTTSQPEKGNAEDINPLGRYYLIYVLDDGTVRLTFAQPKQALNLLRDLAAGHASAFADLCDLFDARTRDGADVTHYDGLIKKALESITHTFSKRAMANLFSERGGKLPNAAESPSDAEEEYELITWLVIMEKTSLCHSRR